MTDDGYTVVLTDGETHHYDNVVTGKGGWLKCFIHRPDRRNKIVAFPPWRVERYENAEVVA